MVITHPTSSPDEVNVAQPGVIPGVGCSIVPTDNLGILYPQFLIFEGSQYVYIQGFVSEIQ